MEVVGVRLARPGAALLAVAVMTGCSSAEDPPRGLREVVLAYVAATQGDDGGAYVEPERQESRDLADGLLALSDGERDRAEALLAAQDYRITRAREHDVVQPRQVPDGRGWGLYAVRPDGRAVAIEVPHPRADRATESFGARLAQAVRARHLLVAGARRERGGGAADVAHEQGSVFAAVHEALAGRGLPAVQVHGFAASSAPDDDVIVSPGASELSPLARDMADRTEAAGLRTCRAWQDSCSDLEGRTNVEGQASERAGSAFVHLEISSAVRDDADLTRTLLGAVAGAVRAGVPRPPVG